MHTIGEDIMQFNRRPELFHKNIVYLSNYKQISRTEVWKNVSSFLSLMSDFASFLIYVNSKKKRKKQTKKSSKWPSEIPKFICKTDEQLEIRLADQKNKEIFHLFGNKYIKY